MTMKAIVMTATGTPEVLQAREVPVPGLPDASHCLVRLAAAGVNPIDCRIRRLHMFHPNHFPAVLGFDGAGVVEKAGSACARFKAGDPVYFCNGGLGGPQGGTYAQYAVVNEAYLARKPERASMQEAAALPLVLITAWEALVFRAGIEAGQRVLVHGGAGGVGHVAVQLARHLRARVAATVGSEDKAGFVRSLGAELAIDHTRQDFVAEVKRWTEREGADVILDTVGGDTFLRSIDAVRLYGRLVTLLSTPIDLAHANKARGRNLVIGYEGMVSPAAMGNHRARLAQTRILEQGARLVDQGKLKVVLGEVLPLEHAAEAHALIEDGHTQGKIVLTLD
jgi:NADPH2:quinone reductase